TEKREAGEKGAEMQDPAVHRQIGVIGTPSDHRGGFGSWVHPDPGEAVPRLALGFLFADMVPQCDGEELVLAGEPLPAGRHPQRHLAQLRGEASIENHRGTTRTNGTMTSSRLRPPW